MKRSIAVLCLAGIGAVASITANATNISLNIGAPAPFVVQPASVAPVTMGWHGDQYYDGQRYWKRDEWQAHEAEMKRHDGHEQAEHWHDNHGHDGHDGHEQADHWHGNHGHDGHEQADHWHDNQGQDEHNAGHDEHGQSGAGHQERHQPGTAS